MKKNAEFLLGLFLNLVQQKYEADVGFKCPTLTKLERAFNNIPKDGTPSNRSNIHKYSSTEYL